MTHNTPAPVADKALAERLDAMPDYWKTSAPRPHYRGEELLPVVYADPGSNGWYYRERKHDSVTAYVRVDLIASRQLITLADAQAMVAAERERCAALIDDWWRGGVDTGVPADMIRAISPTTDKPQTEYERKVAQMKEDFPNGI